MKNKKREWLWYRRKIPLIPRTSYIYIQNNKDTKEKHKVENLSDDGQGVFLATYIFIGLIIFLVIALQISLQ